MKLIIKLPNHRLFRLENLLMKKRIGKLITLEMIILDSVAKKGQFSKNRHFDFLKKNFYTIYFSF